MPKRRFFQMHLSTALILMLVASLLLWVNAREQSHQRIHTQDPLTIVTARTTNRGWPWAFSTSWQRTYNPVELSWPADSEHHVSVSNAACNLVTALAILLPVWQFCEWRIRRKARKL